MSTPSLTRYRESVDFRAQMVIPESVMGSTQPPPPPPPPAAAPPPVYERARALFPYSGGEGHLTIAPGDEIVVVDKDPSGWWVGGKPDRPDVLGVFPGNYVQLI